MIRRPGGDGLPLTGGTLTGSVKLTQSDADSRDNPVNGIVIFENTGLPNNPKMAIGNVYIAGVDIEAFAFYYTDDTLNGEWKLFLSSERSGTFSPVLDGVRRSGAEVHLNHGDYKPITRLFEASSQMMQISSGGFLVAPGGAVRNGGVLTLTTTTINGERQLHKMEVGQTLYKSTGIGADEDVANFGANGGTWGPGGTARTVATVVDEHTITVLDARPNHTNTGWLNFSTEPADDVAFGRKGYGIFTVYNKGGDRLLVTENGIVLPDGLSISPAGTYLNLSTSARYSADIFHVREGKTFYNQGRYRSTGWYNGGGQTQTSQETFVVGTGSGNKTTTLPVIGTDEWMVLRVINEGEGGANTLQIDAGTGNTIKGAASLTIPAYAAVTLTPVGTDWKVLYHPAPP